MANSSMSIFGASPCPAPFVLASKYPSDGGFIAGRFCAPMPALAGGATCCLPCPQTNWVYGDNFHILTDTANYLNVAGMVCCIFLLLSFAALPVEKTHRHYLSVSLVLGVCLMQIAFIIPIGARPKQCYNEITPNDMRSDLTCALSGAFLLAGGWCGVMWVFLRALTLHLQICWQVITGKKFFVGAQLAGWGVPAIMVSVAMTITGVSYRFGDTCHINHSKSIQDFWGPLLAFAAATVIIQFGTFGYCIKVYLQSLMEGNPSTENSSALPSYNGSIHTASARQAYRRVRRVVQLQWRGIAIVVLILADVIFFSIIFVYLDNTTQDSHKNLSKAEPWLFCLILNRGDKNKCLDMAAKLVVTEATVMAVLILMSLNGIWCVVLLGRWSMLSGWREFFVSRFTKKHDFVSVDARRLSSNARTYEMIKTPPQSEMQQPVTVGVDVEKSDMKLGEPVMSPLSAHFSRRGSNTPSGTGSAYGDSPLPSQNRAFSPGSGSRAQVHEGKDYFGSGDERQYSSPHLSFSSPRAPSLRQASSPGRGLGVVGGRIEWDPRSTYARGSNNQFPEKI